MSRNLLPPRHMAVCFTILIVILATTVNAVQQFTVSFSASNSLIVNPERGTYIMQEYSASSWVANSMSSIRQQQKSYANTLWMMEISLDGTLRTSSTLPSAFLTSTLPSEFALYRAAGQKVIVRFVYSLQADAAPFDTTPAIVQSHIQQLGPVLTANQDVILTVQAGFVGSWGEWYYSDNFGNQCSPIWDPQCTTTNVADRLAVVTALLNAVPLRYVQIRTAAWIQTFFGSTPLTSFNMSFAQGRIGFHDDCYGAGSISSGEVGTYEDPTVQYPMMQQWTAYAPFITETCAVASPYSDCANIQQMSAALHMVSSHRNYNTDVWNSWVSQGCYSTILNSLGYRLLLSSATTDLATVAASTFNVAFTIANVGYAQPTYTRYTEVVLRSIDNAAQPLCVARLNVDARTWSAGMTTTVSSVIRLPQTVSSGRYEILLQFADPFDSLYTQPWYKIKLANAGNMVESGTGLHKLNGILTVLDSSSTSAPNAAVAGEVNAVCGLTMASIVAATATTLSDGTCMSGYYLKSGQCTWCPPGYACASSSSQPTACASGTWSSGGQTSCSTIACLNNCNSRGSCQSTSGACVCSANWAGADCSVPLSSVTVATAGTVSIARSVGTPNLTYVNDTATGPTTSLIANGATNLLPLTSVSLALLVALALMNGLAHE